MEIIEVSTYGGARPIAILKDWEIEAFSIFVYAETHYGANSDIPPDKDNCNFYSRLRVMG